LIIIFFGPPGAGKGTQSEYLVNNDNFIQISTGDLLRNEVETQSNYGLKIKKIIDKGELITDELMFDILDQHLTKIKQKKKLIFDGYPRNLKQADILNKLLNKHDLKLDKILFLNVKREEIENRISGRLICSKCSKIFNTNLKSKYNEIHSCGDQYLQKRVDDNYKTILKRYDLYMKETAPLINFYQNHIGFYEIDGNKEIKQISEQIRGFINA